MPPAHRFIGDWLLTFGERSGTLPTRRTADAWSVALHGPAWTLWRAETGQGWRGTPHGQIENDTWLAWLVGELYGDQGLDNVLEVLEDRAPVTKLNGHFMFLAWNKAADEWHIWTNRHATLHGYLALGEAGTVVGTFFPAVAAAAGRSDLDWEGLASFFGFGFFAADRTHLAGVRILRPATHYHLDGNGRLLAATKYWNWWYAPDATRSYDETVEEFAARFAAVMQGLTAASRIAVPISGGLDSRTTVAALSADAGQDHLWSYSYGYQENSIETGIARRVAAARGLPFDAYTIRPYLFDRLTAITDAVEGFEDVTQCRQAAVVSEIDRHADYLIAAHLGDLYLDAMGLTGRHAVPADELTSIALKKVRKTGSDWLLEQLCRPHLGASSPDMILRDLVTGELESLSAIEEPDFRIKAFKVDQWCARWTTVALRMYQAGAFPRLPFYDTRLADFFCTVPSEMLIGRQLQIDYLRRFAPDLARITWQSTGHNLFHDGRAGLLDRAPRAIAKGFRTLSRQRIIERNWEVQFAGAKGRQGLHDWLLQPGLLLHDLVEPVAIGELLAAFERDPYAEKRAYTVSMLVSFSAWLEHHYRNGLGAA